MSPVCRPPLAFVVGSVEYFAATFFQLAGESSFSSAAFAASTFALSLLTIDADVARLGLVVYWVALAAS